ncbi:MAG: hypothetical protein ABEK59_05870 [Halobacteria archaeon]
MTSAVYFEHVSLEMDSMIVLQQLIDNDTRDVLGRFSEMVPPWVPFVAGGLLLLAVILIAYYLILAFAD